MGFLDNTGLGHLISKIKGTFFAKTDAVEAVEVELEIPTKTSDLTNDSGFITSADIPEGSAASTTTPKMDGTAAVGTELAFARGDHIHPSDTSKQDVIDSNHKLPYSLLSGTPTIPDELADLSDDATHRLVTDTEKSTWNGKSDFSGNYNDLTNKPTIPAAQVQSDWNATTGMGAILNKPTIPSNTSDLTNDSGFITIADVPEGSTASTTTPKMDGTAAVGTETAFARGDHIHPSDTSKQDVIGDLADIRAGAALGATALQSFTETDPTVPAWAKASSKPTYTASEVGALPDTTVIPSAPGTLNTNNSTAQTASSSESLAGTIKLHKVSKTGSYSDLNNKPTIPDELADLSDDSTHRLVTDTEKSTWNAKSDFSGSYNDLTNKPTIPAAQVNADWNASSGVAQILNKPTIPTVPTISTDIAADATSDTKTASPKAVKDYVDVPIVTSYPSGGFRPNKIYDLGSQTGSKTYALYTTGLDTTVKNEWVWSFTTGSTAPTITWPSPTGMKWDGGSAPTINSNCLYEISIRRIGSYYVGYYKEIEL